MSKVQGLGWRIALYNLILHGVSLALLPWVILQLIFVPRRKAGIKERLGWAPQDSGNNVWIHAVSVGEVRAVSPMVKLLSEKLTGNCRLLLSTVTVTGHGTARREIESADRIFYFPLDLLIPVKRALSRIRPSLFVTTETEIWPNFLYTCYRQRIPVVLVNGRISDRSFTRYRFFRWFFGPFMRIFDVLLMQSEEDARRVIALGAPEDRVQVTGNMKYDIRPKQFALPDAVHDWAKDSFLLVAGSTHRGEEEVLIDILGEPGLEGSKIVLVPRHPERFDEVETLLSRRNISFVRYSALNHPAGMDSNVMLVDAMGVLDGFYAMADIAFVGGSLVPVGGHNLLEPAMHGKPVLTGPNMHNFRDVTDILIKGNGCWIVDDSHALKEAAVRLKQDEELRMSMGHASMNALRGSTGASNRNADIVLEILKMKFGEP
ncbi:MAG: 3-deoxy-D-manno-octulosonic acid transferase [bacterium]|nr:MAG: 3-deoxy-D-manno-octulosonic acid transferase [bacterium]